jgi:hypothetical protein
MEQIEEISDDSDMMSSIISNMTDDKSSSFDIDCLNKPHIFNSDRDSCSVSVCSQKLKSEKSPTELEL